MDIKVLAIVVVAVLSLQGMAQAKSVAVHEDPAFVEAMTKLKAGIATLKGDPIQTKDAHLNIWQVLQRLDEMVVEAWYNFIGRVVPQFHEIKEDVIVYGSIVVDDDRAKIQDIIATSHGNVEAIWKEAKKNGYDNRQCVDDALLNIDTSGNQAAAKISTCVNDVLVNAEEFYQLISVKIEEDLTFINDVIEAANACQDNACFIEVGKRFYDVLVYIIGELTELVKDDAIVEMTEKYEALIGCSEQTMRDYVADVQKIEDEARQWCLHNKK